MVSASMAKRILPHCPAGPALDILTSVAVQIPGLSASPSADVIRKRIKAGLTIENLISLVDATDSTEILAEIVKRDKRLSVRRAAAENPALGADEVQLLKDDAHNRNDIKTLTSLWAGRDLAGKVALLNEFPHLSWQIGSWSHDLGAAILRGGDPALKLVTAQLDPYKLKELLQSVCDRQYIGKTSAVTLAKAIVKHHPQLIEKSNYRSIRNVTQSLIRSADDVTTWRKVLKVLPDICLVLEAITASEKGTTRLPQAELLGWAQNDRDTEQIVAALASHDVALEPGTVEKALAVPGGVMRALESAKLTPEACAYLAEEGRTELLGLKFWNLDITTQVKYLEEIDGLVEYVRANAEGALELREAGIREDLFWSLIHRCVGKYGELRHSGLRELIVAEAPLETLSLLKLEVRELEAAMQRTDREHVLPSVARNVLANVRELPDDVRKEAQLALPLDDTVFALNSMIEGDLTAYLEECSGEQWTKITEVARQKVLVGDIGRWGGEAVRTLPLEWKDISNQQAVTIMLEVLTNSFGEDREKWQTGLTLLAEWTGTLDELVETVALL